MTDSISPIKQLTLAHKTEFNGEIRLPGSKSLSNRVLLLAALAKGTTTITNLLDSDDIRRMLEALTALGAKVALNAAKDQAVVTGNGGLFTRPLRSEPLELFLGNAGTAYRPLTAVLAASQGEFLLTGEPRMEERPIGHLVDALVQWDADIHYPKQQGYPPVLIHGKALTAGQIRIDGSISSQFLTAALMVAPLLTGDSEIIIEGDLVSKPYIDITLAIMAKFGVSVDNQQYQRFVVKGGQQYQSPGEIMVEGDASSASYFLAAAAISGGQVTVHGVGTESTQGDVHFAEILAKMGAEVEWQPTSITVRGQSLTAVDLDMNHIPDAAMTIATTALFATGTTAIRNVYNWRVKETDRLSAMATELRKVGAGVVEGEDYIEITPPPVTQHAEIDTYNDHRMAMCFSLLAFAKNSVTINDPDCTSKTFPTYFREFERLAK